MNAMTAFFKKELREAVATHKLTVLGLVFLLFGIMNPLMAKLLPDILGSVLPEGMTVTLPTTLCPSTRGRSSTRTSRRWG